MKAINSRTRSRSEQSLGFTKSRFQKSIISNAVDNFTFPTFIRKDSQEQFFCSNDYYSRSSVKSNKFPFPQTKPYTQSHVRLIYIQSKCGCVSVGDRYFTFYIISFFALLSSSLPLTSFLWFALLDTLHRTIYMCVD